MSCQQFDEQGWLYLSGELDRSESLAFERHLQGCEACRAAVAEARQWTGAVRELPQERPAASVRRAILAEAKAQRPRTGVWHRWLEWHRALAWGVPSLATAAVVVLFLLRSFSGVGVRPDLLTWEGGFRQETQALDQAISAVETEAARDDLETWDEPAPLSIMESEIHDLRQDLGQDMDALDW